MWWCIAIVEGIRIRGGKPVGDEIQIQLKLYSTEYGLVWGVWFAWVVEEGIVSLW